MTTDVTVVKLGGSLQQADLLPPWLDLLARHGAGRVVVVPGGGRFADQARAAQAHWKFDDLHAHNMAVLGMTQMAQLFHALQPQLQLAGSVAQVRTVLAARGVPLWQLLDLLRESPDELTNWDTTSDSLAAWLALQLGAQRLWLVKSCVVPADMDVQALADGGIVDRALPGWMRRWRGELRVVQAADWREVESALAAEPLQGTAAKGLARLEAKDPAPPTQDVRQPTKRQLEYLTFIARYTARYGRPPAESDIERHFLVSAPSVNQMMQTLERLGFISRRRGVPRSVQICIELPRDAPRR